MAALGNASHASQIRMGVCARMYDVVCPLGRMLTIAAGDETEPPLMPGCDRYVALVGAVFGCLGLIGGGNRTEEIQNKTRQECIEYALTFNIESR